VGQGDDVTLAVAAASVLRSVAVTVRPPQLTAHPALGTLAAAVVASASSGADAALGTSTRAAHLRSPRSPALRPTTAAASGPPKPSDVAAADGGGSGGSSDTSWRRSATLALVSAWSLPLPSVRDADQGWDQRTAGVTALLQPLVATLCQMAEHPDFVSGGFYARTDGPCPSHARLCAWTCVCMYVYMCA
jgi:hypothetical protein